MHFRELPEDLFNEICAGMDITAVSRSTLSATSPEGMYFRLDGYSSYSLFTIWASEESRARGANYLVRVTAGDLERGIDRNCPGKGTRFEQGADIIIPLLFHKLLVSRVGQFVLQVVAMAAKLASSGRYEHAVYYEMDESIGLAKMDLPMNEDGRFEGELKIPRSIKG